MVALGLGVLTLCVFALPAIWRGGSAEFPEASGALFLIIVGLYATVGPFYIALWKILRLLNHVDRGTFFSEQSVKVMGDIKHCAVAISVLYITGLPLLYPIAEADDAPGLLLIGAAFACVPMVVAVAVSVLQRLVRGVRFPDVKTPVASDIRK